MFVVYDVIHVSFAGSLTPDSSPASVMYTLEDIYNKINHNNNLSLGYATEGAQSFSTPATVSSSFHSLKQIYESIPTLDASKILSGKTMMGVTGTLTPIPGLPKTGQVACAGLDDPFSDPIPCTGTGQDADYQAGVTPSGGAARFTDNNNGTITDNITGLMWKKCTIGLSGSGCTSGSATSMDWSTALNTCEADFTNGHVDWRLPNRIELLSLVDIRSTVSNAAIDPTYFPNTVKDNYASSTTYQIFAQATKAWGVDFTNGVSLGVSKSSTFYTRCVR